MALIPREFENGCPTVGSRGEVPVGDVKQFADAAYRL